MCRPRPQPTAATAAKAAGAEPDDEDGRDEQGESDVDRADRGRRRRRRPGRHRDERAPDPRGHRRTSCWSGDRIAERWRSGRWDSLVANGPAWHDRFPGREFDLDPDAFAAKEQVADYLVAYAEQVGAPIRTGVEVQSVRPHEGRPGFRVTTSAGEIDARFVVAATGPFQRPVIPAVVPAAARDPPAALERLPQPGAAAGRWRARRRRRILRRADRRRAAPRRARGVPLGRPARPPAAPLPRTATSAGGWACSASGTWPLRPPARST